MSKFKKITARRAVFNTFAITGIVVAFPAFIVLGFVSQDLAAALEVALILGAVAGAFMGMAYYVTAGDRHPAIVQVKK